MARQAAQPSSKILLRVLGNGEVSIEKGDREAAKLLGYPAPPRSISIVEATYLVYSGQAQAVDEKGKELGFQDLVSLGLRQSPYAWVLFEVYLDLRKRGKIPVPGPRRHSILIRRSKGASRYTHYILVLEESRRIGVEELLSFVEESMHNGWEPVVAIVDRYGDITYYSMRPLHPRQGSEL